MWKEFVVAVVWNNPPNIPTPLARNRRDKFSQAIKAENSKIIIVVREYNMDLSRLEVMELDNNNKINELNNI